MMIGFAACGLHCGKPGASHCRLKMAAESLAPGLVDVMSLIIIMHENIYYDTYVS